MKKNGFTLTEALLTLSIIGVLAVLLLPRMIQHVNNSYAGASLSKVVSQIESGCQTMISTATERTGHVYTTLGDINAGDILHVTNASVSEDAPLAVAIKDIGYTYLNLDPLDSTRDGVSNIATNITSYDGSSISDDEAKIADSSKYQCKGFPANVYITSDITADSNDISDADATIATVYIDVNGYGETPIKFGKDLFVFELKNNGKMIPYGIDEDDSYKDNCSNSKITNGKACTARVVTDGWQIKY